MLWRQFWKRALQFDRLHIHVSAFFGREEEILSSEDALGLIPPSGFEVGSGVISWV